MAINDTLRLNAYGRWRIMMSSTREKRSNLETKHLWGRSGGVNIVKVFHSCMGYARTPGWVIMRDYVFNHFGSFNGLRSIELGSGLGKISVLFSLMGADVTLLDYNEKQLTDAGKVHEYFSTSASLIKGNLLDLPDSLHESFDIVMSFGTAEHFWGDERQAVFGSHFKVLKSGGIAIIWVPNKYGLLFFVGRKIRKIFGRILDAIPETPYNRYELHKRSIIAGFRDPIVRGGESFLGDFNQFIINCDRFSCVNHIRQFSGDAEKDRNTLHTLALWGQSRITLWGNYFSYPLVLIARRE